MKRVKFFLMIAVLGWMFTACTENTDLTTPDLSLDSGMDDLVGTEDFSQLTDLLATPELTTPDENIPLEVVEDGFPEDPSIWAEEEDPQGLGKKRHCDLNLSDEQKAQMMEARKAFVACIKPQVQAIRQIVKSVLTEANAQRKELIDQYQNGTISKEELKAALKALKQQTIETIKSNEDIQTGIDAIKECHAAFVDAAMEILTEEQFAQWQECKKKAKRWVKNHKKKRRGKRGG